MSYTDRIKIATYLQRELTNEEQAVLVMLIPAIQKWIDARTGSTFDKIESPTTRYYDGGGTSVDIDPCTEISTVSYIDNDNTNVQDFVLYTDYVVEPANETVKREIVRRHGCFQPGLRRVAVTAKFSEYDEGVPEDIELVATRLAGSILKGSKNDAIGAGLKSESLEGHSVTYATSNDDIASIASNDPIIKSILEQHSEILVG